MEKVIVADATARYGDRAGCLCSDGADY
jgi:hypothetical protein